MQRWVQRSLSQYHKEATLQNKVVSLGYIYRNAFSSSRVHFQFENYFCLDTVRCKALLCLLGSMLTFQDIDWLLLLGWDTLNAKMFGRIGDKMSGSFVAKTIAAFIFKVLSGWLGSKEWLPFYRKASYGCRFSDFYSLPLGQEEIGCIYNMELMRECCLSSQCNRFLSSCTHYFVFTDWDVLLLTPVITRCLQAEEMTSKDDW